MEMAWVILFSVHNSYHFRLKETKKDDNHPSIKEEDKWLWEENVDKRVIWVTLSLLTIKALPQVSFNTQN